MVRLVLLILVLMLFFSCRNDELIPPPDLVKQYLHISHTRTNNNNLIDSVAESIRYQNFDMLWLGGDLTYTTSEDDGTMSYIDSIFTVSSENTLWSLGNHDYSELSRIQEFTNRLPYYSCFRDGITFLVLDTQDSLSNIVGEQKLLFDNVLDTIQESTHLILLHHKLIWMYGDFSLEQEIDSVSNGHLGNCFHCINPNRFWQDLYPKLVVVQKKGINVICVGGDIGVFTNEYEYLTQDNVQFLASGIKNGTNNNKALIFKHDVTNGYLFWEFELLENLTIN